MTIAAGFAFNGGVILCADTQETIGSAKRWVPKLLLEPVRMDGLDGVDDLMIAMAGAGDGPFMDKIVERAWDDSQSAQSFGDACRLIERSIEATYTHYGTIFQPGYIPMTEIVYGVKMQGQSKLYTAIGP